jgi:hypothetical protein
MKYRYRTKETIALLFIILAVFTNVQFVRILQQACFRDASRRPRPQTAVAKKVSSNGHEVNKRPRTAPERRGSQNEPFQVGGCIQNGAKDN